MAEWPLIGREPIAAVEQFHPEVVLLDEQLPDIDVFEVVDRVCGLSFPTATIRTSIRHEPDLRTLLRNFPVCGFITKSNLPAAGVVALVGDGP